MPGEVIQVEAINFAEVAQAFREAPELATRYLKSEMLRATARVRKRFMALRMHGPPGIQGGAWLKQHKRHIKYWVAGTGLASLQATIRIDRFLGLHESGGVITAHNKGRDMLRIPIGPRWKLPTRGGFDGNRIKGLIFIRRPGKSPLLAEKVGDQLIPRFVLKGRVVVKARLGFKETVLKEWPTEFPKLQEALHRALRVSLDQRMKDASAFVTRLVA
jgi:hypothetical protein